MMRSRSAPIIALAHKFLKLIYNTLTCNWVCADFANFELAEAS